MKDMENRPMEITFELTEEDYIHYNIAHSEKSPSMKRSLLIQRIMGPVIFVFMPFIVIRFTDIPLWYWLLVFGVSSITWFVFYPKYAQWEITRRVQKMLEEGSNENLFNQRSLVLTDEGITETSSIGENHIRWDKINHLEETEDYLYIYISSVSAHIVPKRVFENSNEQEKFINKITKHIQSR